MATKTKSKKSSAKKTTKAKAPKVEKAPFKLCIGRTDKQGKYGFNNTEYNSIGEILAAARKAVEVGKDKGVHEVNIVLVK